MYFWPPPPNAYDPAPRPLRWSGQIRGGIGTIPDVRGMIPSDEDAYTFILDPDWCTSPDQSGFPVCATDVHDQTPSVPPGGTNFQQRVAASSLGNIGGWMNGPIPPGRPGVTPMSGFRLGKSPYYRLAYYARMFIERAPEDPQGGGLPEDTIEGNSIVINYWDSSDENRPKRKRVRYTPRPNGIDTKIEEWNPFTQQWGDEGFDFEKQFVGNLQQLVASFIQISSAAISIMTANPALGQAWAQIGNAGLNSAITGQPPTLEGFGQLAAGYLGAIPGAFDSFGKIMSNELNPLSQSDFVRSLRGAIVRAGQEGEAYFDKVKKAIVAFQGTIPKIDYPNVLKGAVPKELQDMASKGQIQIPDFHAAVHAAQNVADSFLTYSLRKTASDKDVFDATYSSVLASAPIPIHAAAAIRGTLTPLYAEPLEQQIATWQQLYAYWLSKGRPEAPMAAQKIATLQAELANQKAALADPVARKALDEEITALRKRYGM
jgi:hypothetical protein